MLGNIQPRKIRVLGLRLLSAFQIFAIPFSSLFSIPCRRHSYLHPTQYRYMYTQDQERLRLISLEPDLDPQPLQQRTSILRQSEGKPIRDTRRFLELKGQIRWPSAWRTLRSVNIHIVSDLLYDWPETSELAASISLICK